MLLEAFFPSPDFGALFLTAAAVACAASLFAAAKEGSRAASAWLWAAVALGFVSQCFFRFTFIDEVFINFKHPWNLFHYGRFSFSPGRMVLGTVEVAYYAALTPFAFSRAALVQAGYALDLAVGLGHLALIAAFVRKARPAASPLALLPFLFYTPLVARFTDGFGTELLSLALLAAAYAYLCGRHKAAFWLAASMGAIRPEGIAYYLIFLCLDLWTERKYSWRMALVGLFPAAGYALFVKTLFGYWIPTPVLFKVRMAVSAAERWEYTAGSLRYFAANVTRYAPYVPLFLLAVFRKGASKELSYLRKLALPLGVVCFSYLVSASGPRAGLNTRYHGPYEALLITLICVGAAEWMDSFSFARKRGWAMSSALVAGGLALGVLAGRLEKDPLDFAPRVLRGTSLGVGGQFVDTVTPADWRIAASEIDSFGYMNDRDILDLWGYTNRDIAESAERNRFGVRVKPGLFLSDRPEMYWFRTVPKGYYDKMPDERILAFRNFSRSFNNLGDMRRVVAEYTFFKIFEGNWLTMLLVRNDKAGEFSERLVRDGFAAEASKALDEALVNRYYEESIFYE